MYYIILDMEWNQALDRAHTVEKPVLLRGEIIQIGAVKCDEDFNLVDRLKINVAPKYYKKMNRHVEKITGITNAMLAKGEKFPEAFAKLREWCTPEFRFITWGFDDARRQPRAARVRPAVRQRLRQSTAYIQESG